MEDHSSEPTASIVPDESPKLFVWTNEDSISNMYVMDCHWPSAWVVSVFVSGDVRPIRVEFGARKNASAYDRILGLAGGVRGCGGGISIIGADSIEGYEGSRASRKTGPACHATNYTGDSYS